MDTEGPKPLGGSTGGHADDGDDAPFVYTHGRIRRVPNAPKTPNRAFRIPEALYREAQQIAAERGETLSDVVRDALKRYVQRHRKPPQP